MPGRTGQRFAKRYGPWAVITGVSDGIGRNIAARLAEAGINTVLVDRHRERRADGVDVLAAHGPVHTGLAARTGMTLGIGWRPEQIGAATRDALGWRVTVRSGWLSKVLEASSLGTPRSIRSRILGQGMKSMAQADAPPADQGTPQHA